MANRCAECQKFISASVEVCAHCADDFDVRFWRRVERVESGCWKWLGLTVAAEVVDFHAGWNGVAASELVCGSVGAEVPRDRAPPTVRTDMNGPESNTYLRNGRRQCRDCNREAVRRYAARRAGKSA